MLDAAKAQYPGKPMLYISQEPDDNTFWYVSLAEPLDEIEKFDVAAVDSRTAEVLGTGVRYISGYAELPLVINTNTQRTLLIWRWVRSTPAPVKIV